MNRQEFVNYLLPYALDWEKQTGIPAEVFLAIGASESNWGATTTLFGIKGSGTAGGQNYGTHEIVNGQRQDITDQFATYNNPNEAFQAFVNLMQTSRYRDTWNQYQQNGDWMGLLRGIVDDGYATDKSWPDSIARLASTFSPTGEVGGTNSGAPSAQAAVGPNGRTVGQITGTDYQSPEERVWYLQQIGRTDLLSGQSGSAGPVNPLTTTTQPPPNGNFEHDVYGREPIRGSTSYNLPAPTPGRVSEPGSVTASGAKELAKLYQEYLNQPYSSKVITKGIADVEKELAGGVDGGRATYITAYITGQPPLPGVPNTTGWLQYIEDGISQLGAYRTAAEAMKNDPKNFDAYNRQQLDNIIKDVGKQIEDLTADREKANSILDTVKVQKLGFENTLNDLIRGAGAAKTQPPGYSTWSKDMKDLFNQVAPEVKAAYDKLPPAPTTDKGVSVSGAGAGGSVTAPPAPPITTLGTFNGLPVYDSRDAQVPSAIKGLAAAGGYILDSDAYGRIHLIPTGGQAGDKEHPSFTFTAQDLLNKQVDLGQFGGAIKDSLTTLQNDLYQQEVDRAKKLADLRAAGIVVPPEATPLPTGQNAETASGVGPYSAGQNKLATSIIRNINGQDIEIMPYGQPDVTRALASTVGDTPEKLAAEDAGRALDMSLVPLPATVTAPSDPFLEALKSGA